MATRARYGGQRLKRLEDGKFLRGDGRYVDDITLPGTLHVVFVRSMDYFVPRADTMPAELEVSHLETPSPLTVRGMKGMGEGGTVGAVAAIANAVADALAPFDPRVDRTPLTAERVRSLVERR